MKRLLKWILPRYVKEARDRRKTEGKKEGKGRESSKHGEKCIRGKNEAEGHKTKSRHYPLHFHCSYMYYTTTSNSEISLQKFSCHENLE